MIALGAKYQLSCLAVLVNWMLQHNNGKVTSKDREKHNCQSITLASTLAEIIYHKQNSRTWQPRTTGSSRTREVIFGKGVAAEKQEIHSTRTIDTQVKEVLLVFDEGIHVG